MARKKPHINLVIIGHVDHGKSTAIGHFLYLVGAIDDRVIKKYEEEAKQIGRESWKFAWVLDKLAEERKRGLTIDLGYFKFETPKYMFTIIDAPGHRDFIKNMITGASQADAAILVVSAKRNEFEAGYALGGQTREHAILAKTLGIDQMIVLVNKMDAVNWDKSVYEEIRDEMKRFLTSIGYKPDQIKAIIPTSGLLGDNLKEKSPNMPWYDGPTLYEALDLLEPPKPMIDKPFRLPIQKVFKIKGVGTVVTGRVETGKLKKGDSVIIQPLGKQSVAQSIEMHHEPLEEAVPGDNVGVNLKGISADEVKRGDVMGHPDNPPTVVGPNYGTFLARLWVIWHPTSISAGYTPVMHAHTLQVAVRFVHLHAKYGPKGELIEENPSFIKRGEYALVELEPIKPSVVEKFSEFPPLGRFAIRDTVGAHAPTARNGTASGRRSRPRDQESAIIPAELIFSLFRNSPIFSFPIANSL
ncbi:MAG: translation elongation factor EF-1 subunit alpha [Candidatus Njordarchaeales archaeon]